jgi:uncharacterized protein YciI
VLVTADGILMKRAPRYRRGVFVITLTYLVDLSDVDAALADHGAWLDRQYEDGVFIASGRQVPRVGGVILATGLSRDDLGRRLAEDPFHQRGIAGYTVTEFIVSRVRKGSEDLLEQA